MDKERRNHRLDQKSKASLVSSLSLLQSEIELDGRRLIVKEQVSREAASGIRQKQEEEKKREKELEDKRNIGMAKEGLLNEESWLQTGTTVTKMMMEMRQRLY